MGLVPWQVTVTNETKQVVPNPVVTVRVIPGGGLATIYSDRDGTSEVNPITGDANGFVQFWLSPGEYSIDGAKDGDLVDTWYFDAGTDFASRSDFVAAVADGWVPTGGTTVRIGDLSWVFMPAGHALYGTDPIPALPGWLPVGDWQADHFAENTEPGTTDMTAAVIRATEQLLATDARGVLYFNPVDYLLSAPINLSGSGIVFSGITGEKTTRLQFNHTGSGSYETAAGVIVDGRYSGLRYMEIEAVGARAAAGYNEFAPGVMLNPADSSSNNCWNFVLSDVQIHGHPGDGLLAVGATWQSEIRNVRIYDNGGRGLRFDNGELTGRINKANPGQIKIDRAMVYDNGGHGLQIGDDNSASNRGFRFEIKNLDCYRNATDPAARKSADQVWAFMDAGSIKQSAFDGRSLDETSIVTRGMLVAGRSLTIENNRYLNVTPNAIKVQDLYGTLGYRTEGVEIDGMSVFQDGTPLEALVSVDPTCLDVQVTPRSSNSQFEGPVPLSTEAPLVKRVQVARLRSTVTVNNSTTLTAISDLSVPIKEKEIVQFEAILFYRGDTSADVDFAMVGPAGASMTYSLSGAALDTGGSVSTPSVKFGSGTRISLGTASGNASRVAHIVGEIKTNGTAGSLEVQFSQNTAVSADTQVLSQSHMKLTRH